MMSNSNRLGMILKVTLLVLGVVVLAEVQAYQTSLVPIFKPQVESANI